MINDKKSSDMVICHQLAESQLNKSKLDLAEVAEATRGLTGADLRALLHTASLAAENNSGDHNFLLLV